MRNRVHTLALPWMLALGGLACLSGESAHGAAPDAENAAPARIEAEVERWYRDSFEKPIAGKQQPFVDEVSAVYAPPLRYLELDGEIMLGDAAAARDFIQGFSDWLDSAPGWTASVERIQARALNATAATLIVDWRILTADGKPLAGSDPVQYYYVVSKQAGNWKVVTEATVMPETRIDFK